MSVLGRLIVVVVNRYALQVFGFKDLVTVQASDIIDPVTPCENLSARMLTIRHIEGDYPYSKRAEWVVKHNFRRMTGGGTP
jgi:hypothetical protein